MGATASVLPAGAPLRRHLDPSETLHSLMLRWLRRCHAHPSMLLVTHASALCGVAVDWQVFLEHSKHVLLKANTSVF